MKKGFDNSIMAKNIKYLRCKLNITMTQLSEKLDLKSKSAILAYENGISEPSLKGLLILSDMRIISLSMDVIAMVVSLLLLWLA